MSASITIKFFVKNQYVNGVGTKLQEFTNYENVPHRLSKRKIFAYNKGLQIVKALPHNTGDVLGVYVYDQKDRLLAAWRQMDNYGGRMTGTYYDPFGNVCH